MSLTYINEYETYQISDEALNDPTFRDDLIALGLDPRTGEGRGTRSAIAIDGGRNTTNNLLEAKRGYVAAIHLEQAGTWLGGTWDYFELTSEGRYFRSLNDRIVFAVQGRAGSLDAIGDPEIKIDITYEGPDPVVTTVDSTFYRALESAVKRRHPDATVTPMVVPYGTDSNGYRPRGVKSYGFTPVIVPAEAVMSMHGDAEYLPIDAVAPAIQVLFEALKETVAK